MPDPKPVKRPVKLPDLTVRGGTASPVEVALRLMGAPDDIRTQGQANFRQRREAFHRDFPRALPGGAAQMLGTLGTDIASVNLPFVPALLPRVQQQGDEWTQALTEGLHRFLGAEEGTEGTQTGEEIGGILASALPLELGLPLAGKALDKLPDLEVAGKELVDFLRPPGMGGPAMPRMSPIHEYQLYQEANQVVPRWLQEAVDAQEARVIAEEAAQGFRRPEPMGQATLPDITTYRRRR